MVEILSQSKELLSRDHESLATCTIWMEYRRYISLDDHLATWMPYAVKATVWYILYYTKNTAKDEERLYYCIVAWEALWHLCWNCECYAAKIDGMDHDKFWQRRYEFCMPIFAKTMRRLWW